MADTTFWDGSEQYLCDKELAQAFHIARTLGMPLLIEGEPGTGKTELPLQFAASQQTEMFVYPAGSKSTVEQFVAKFDHVKYLRDSQIEILNAQRNEKGLETKLSTGGRDTENLSDYVACNIAFPLAFRLSCFEPDACTASLLIKSYTINPDSLIAPKP